MDRIAGRTWAWALGLNLLLGLSASAQGWVETVFPERAYDFGTVARGSKVRHTFRLINTTAQDIQIADWRTKCGCTEVKIGAREIPPGTQTTIEAVIDTTRFQGYKASGLTLVLSKPNFAEIDLNLTCFIRGDIWLDPGLIDFGVIKRGESAKVEINLVYNGGQPSWGVSEMSTLSPKVKAKLDQTSRLANGEVRYHLTATLETKDVQGHFKDEITLKTNDPTTPSIPISVTANVQSLVTVSPSIVNLGRLKPGSTVKKTIVVRSSKPFHITQAKSAGSDMDVAVDPKRSATVHPLAVTFKAPSRMGPYHADLEIETDVKDEPPARITTFATIEP